MKPTLNFVRSAVQSVGGSSGWYAMFVHEREHLSLDAETPVRPNWLHVHIVVSFNKMVWFTHGHDKKVVSQVDEVDEKMDLEEEEVICLLQKF